MKLIIAILGLVACASAAYQEAPCGNINGKCMDMRECNGKNFNSKCPTQGSNIKCCVGHKANAGKPAVYQENRCARVGGECRASNDCGAPSFQLKGKCPTQRNVFCCMNPLHQQQSVDVSNPACVIQAMHEEGEVFVLNAHVSGVRDDATALQNVLDACEGKEGSRSCYENAPCGKARVDNRVWEALIDIVPKFQEKYGRPVQVNEVLGGSHSKRSKHYPGLAIDFQNHSPGENHFLHDLCIENGASLVCALKSKVCAKGHRTHVHCQWS